jgi:hypothetical protein
MIAAIVDAAKSFNGGGHCCLGFFRASDVERAEFYLNWEGPPLIPNGVIKGSASNQSFSGNSQTNLPRRAVFVRERVRPILSQEC